MPNGRMPHLDIFSVTEQWAMSIEILNEVSIWSYDGFATVLSKQALQTRHPNFVECVNWSDFRRGN
jgi:hypothetical protein